MERQCAGCRRGRQGLTVRAGFGAKSSRSAILPRFKIDSAVSNHSGTLNSRR